MSRECKYVHDKNENGRLRKQVKLLESELEIFGRNKGEINRC